MIKIKHKELALLLGISEEYSRRVLSRNKLRIENRYLVEIIDLIVEKRMKQKQESKNFFI
jgi:hypothetical protein